MVFNIMAATTPLRWEVVLRKVKLRGGSNSVASQFVTGQSKNHTVFYNGKIVNMDYLGKKPKDEFKFAGMRIADNLSTGGVGFIKTPKGEFYKVSSNNRSAKKSSKEEVLATTK